MRSSILQRLLSPSKKKDDDGEDDGDSVRCVSCKEEDRTFAGREELLVILEPCRHRTCVYCFIELQNRAAFGGDGGNGGVSLGCPKCRRDVESFEYNRLEEEELEEEGGGGGGGDVGQAEEAPVADRKRKRRASSAVVVVEVGKKKQRSQRERDGYGSTKDEEDEDGEKALLVDDDSLRQLQRRRRNTAAETRTVHAWEYARIAVVTTGIGLGFGSYYRAFAVSVVSGLGGLVGLEGLCIPDLSARDKQWPTGCPYQRQTACSNLSSAIVLAILLVLEHCRSGDGATNRSVVDDSAYATLVLVVVTFVFCSSINHLVTELRDSSDAAASTTTASRRESAVIHYQRFALSLPLLAACLIIVFGMWKPFS